MLIVKRYSAEWCSPCKQLAPVFEELKNELTEVTFETIDVDQNKESVIAEGIVSVPTVVLEKDGEQVYRFSGVLPKSVIAGVIKKYL
jgi:thioredoxin 1